MFNPSFTTNHDYHLARIKHVVVLSNRNPNSLTNHSELCGYEKRPPPEPPPSEEAKILRAFVCVSVIFIVLYCFGMVCIVCLILVYFKFALIVFEVPKMYECIRKYFEQEFNSGYSKPYLLLHSTNESFTCGEFNHS
ncbi:hypothetical protein QL285_023777 [Trifolium repens]|nr:hypothetical protein QL285_023777 [Trifolium repens]